VVSGPFRDQPLLGEQSREGFRMIIHPPLHMDRQEAHLNPHLVSGQQTRESSLLPTTLQGVPSGAVDELIRRLRSTSNPLEN